jgi:hypothetical protein
VIVYLLVEANLHGHRYGCCLYLYYRMREDCLLFISVLPYEGGLFVVYICIAVWGRITCCLYLYCRMREDCLLFISVLPYEGGLLVVYICIVVWGRIACCLYLYCRMREDWDHIYWFNLATFCTSSKARIHIIIGIWRFFCFCFLLYWFEVKGCYWFAELLIITV